MLVTILFSTHPVMDKDFDPRLVCAPRAGYKWYEWRGPSTALAPGCHSEKTAESAESAIAAYKKYANAYFGLSAAPGLPTGQGAQGPGDKVDWVLEQGHFGRRYRETVRQIHNAAYEVISEKRAEDGGSVTLIVRVKATIDLPGTHTVYGSARAFFLHNVVLTRNAGSWKVSAFEDMQVTQ